jgi:hypothetical protein
MVMKRSLFSLICALTLFISCTKETPRSKLLEYNIGDKIYSYDGYAYRYTDYIGNEKHGFDWHIYNHGQTSIYIQAYDSTYIENVFDFPAFEARLTVELPDGKSKIYQATAGQFRITGQEMWDVQGDFHFKVKNIADPLDSMMITQGYYRIFLEDYNRHFSK